MTDRASSDLAALLTPPPARGVQFTQARVLEWDSAILSNALEWRGITIRDVPIIEGINALTIRPGDIVGMLGWAPENAKGVGSWWIIGKLSTPGEFVADIFIFSRQVRFMTPDDNTLAYFGVDSDGEPLLALFYGGGDEQRAFQIINDQHILMSYRNGVQVFATSGTPGNQSFQFRDQSGFEVVGSDGATGLGLSRPWIPYLMNPTHDAEVSAPTYTPATTSGSFVDLWRGFNPVFHPRVAYGISVFGAAREWRIRVNPGSGFSTVASGTGSSGGTFDIPGWGPSGTTPGTEVEFDLQLRVTSGGTAHATIDKFYGRQS